MNAGTYHFPLRDPGYSMYKFKAKVHQMCLPYVDLYKMVAKCYLEHKTFGTLPLFA